MQAQLTPFTRPDATLHYRSTGTGPAVLLLPGSISDHRTWDPVVEGLSRSHRCIVASRRYQHPARYPQDGDGGVQKNVDDIAALIQHLGSEPVHVIGHSFGGYIAMELALQHPQLVSRLVLEEPIFTPALVTNPNNPLQLIRLFIRDRRAGASFMRLGMKGVSPTFKALAKGDKATAMRCFIDGVTEGKRTTDQLDALTRTQLEDNIMALAGEDPFKHHFKGSLSSMRVPALALHGTESPYFFHFICKSITRACTTSRIRVIDGAAHWIHVDRPAEYVEAVHEFFSEDSSGSR